MLENQLFLYVFKNEYLSRRIFQLVNVVNNISVVSSSSYQHHDDVIVRHSGSRDNNNRSYKLREMNTDTIFSIGSIRLYMYLLSLPKQARATIRKDGSVFKTTLSVKLLKKFFGACRLYDDYLKVYKRYKHVFVVALKQSYPDDEYYNGGVFDSAAKTGNVDILKHLHAQGFKPHPMMCCLRNAIDFGKTVEAVRYLAGSDIGARVTKDILLKAIKDVEIFKELEKHVSHEEFQNYRNDLINVSVSTNLETFKYLQRFEDIVRLLVEHASINNEHIIGSGMRLAVFNGHIEIVKYLYKYQKDHKYEHNIDNSKWDSLIVGASQNNHFDIVRFFFTESKPRQFNHFILNWAIVNGNHEFAYEMIHKYSSLIDHSNQQAGYLLPLSSAACSGNIDLLTLLMDVGYVLQKDMLNEGVRTNHLHIVEYLYEKFGLELTLQSLETAITSNSIQVIKYIQGQNPSLVNSISPDTMVTALKSNYIETVEWLFQTISPIDPSQHLVIVNCLYTCHPKIIEFVLDTVKRDGFICTLEPFQSLLEKAIRNDNVAAIKTISQWMDKNCLSVKKSIGGLLLAREFPFCDLEMIRTLWKERLFTIYELAKITPLDQRKIADEPHPNRNVMVVEFIYSLLHTNCIGYSKLASLTYAIYKGFDKNFPCNPRK
ncbi:hypothetical protein DFA_03143 [Cavenderia fasciculata]|uniref:Ankyrin repeat-containing protein n=1 Tax=Cavenderia fasciculata TaxID=261658 RepID=F4PGR4_CACFS|nr:uncharacterized protein DFA_03143 [Cavenderia fasciculata]EGG24898.1 hypothetical protein DFA_03143 [Cavenderia fasciculata]|eukprot:XP_004362749.1 hypothetical protein DFA_03143 [Cavenderia fasciculata]